MQLVIILMCQNCFTFWPLSPNLLSTIQGTKLCLSGLSMKLYLVQLSQLQIKLVSILFINYLIDQ